MNNFETMFPNFLPQCMEMNRVLTPIAFVLLVVGIVSSTISGQRSAGAYARTFARTFAYATVLASLATWGGEVAAIVDTTVRDTLNANPAEVQAQYQKALEVKKGTGEERSWWDVLDGQALFETAISCVMWALGWIASVIVFYSHLVQKFVLYLAYALAPIFIGFLAVRTLHSIGVSFLLGFAGILCWPLGWGAASLVTAGLIDFMTDQSFFAAGGVGAGAGYGFQNLMGVAVLAVWLITTTIAAPVLIQKAISTGANIGGALLATTAVAGAAGATAGTGAAAAISSGGGLIGGLAGIAGGAAAATVGATEAATTGSSYSPMGNLLGSLASQRGASRRPTKPKKDDPTGDQAVRELLEKSRN